MAKQVTKQVKSTKTTKQQPAPIAADVQIIRAEQTGADKKRATTSLEQREALQAAIRPSKAKTDSTPVAPVVSANAPIESTQKVIGWILHSVPGGRVLRAYFLAMIAHQQGVSSVDDLKYGLENSFRLWAGANLLTHLQSGRLGKNGKAYHLTHVGKEYFASSKERPTDEAFNAFLAFQKTGEKPVGFDLPGPVGQIYA